jgi:hypothetical protein
MIYGQGGTAVPDWIASLFIKVGVSVASGVVIFLAGRFWKSLLRPWIENIWYGGFRLAPCYVGEFTFEGIDRTDLIELNQKATKVWGTMTFPAGGQALYRFEATVLDRVLRGTYEGVRINPHVHGSFLLVNTPGQRDLEGWFLEPYKGGVIAARYKWTPKST